MKRLKLFLIGYICLLFLGSIKGQIQNDPILKIIKTEVDRNKSGLHIGSSATPFWASGVFLKNTRTIITAASGFITSQSMDDTNEVGANILVGNHKLSNGLQPEYANSIYGTNNIIGTNNFETELPIRLWGILDFKYKSAVVSLEDKKNKRNQQNIPQEELNINDLDQSTPVQYFQEKTFPKLNMIFLADYCRKASQAIQSDTSFYGTNFSITINQGVYYYYSTDGFMYKYPTQTIAMDGSLRCRGKDGQVFSSSYKYCYDEIDDLPSIKDLCSEISTLNKLLVEQSNAPTITEVYSGPVLFEGTAVSSSIQTYFIGNGGIFANSAAFRFSFSINGPGSTDGINRKIADSRLDFISMTGTPQWNGKKLLGYTPIDAQGVKPDKSLLLVEKGIIKNWLSDRTPTKSSLKSNGHNLFEVGSRCSSLNAGVLRVKATSNTTPAKELKTRLLAEAKEEGYQYAYIKRGFEHLENHFVYRVYPDGREEMVRNVDMPNLNQASFKEINEISTEEFLDNSSNRWRKLSLITPYSLIFKRLDCSNRRIILPSNPHILPRPKPEN